MARDATYAEILQRHFSWVLVKHQNLHNANWRKTMPTTYSSFMQQQLVGKYGKSQHWRKHSGASFVLIIGSATRMGQSVCWAAPLQELVVCFKVIWPGWISENVIWSLGTVSKSTASAFVKPISENRNKSGEFSNYHLFSSCRKKKKNSLIATQQLMSELPGRRRWTETCCKYCHICTTVMLPCLSVPVSLLTSYRPAVVMGRVLDDRQASTAELYTLLCIVAASGDVIM